MNKPKIAIIGSGAIGSVLALSMANSFQVYFVGRDGPIAHHVEAQVGMGKVESHFFLKATLAELKECHLVLVAVKAYDLEEALDKNLSLVSDKAVVVFLSNGFIEPIINKFVQSQEQKTFRMGYCNFGVSLHDKIYTLHSKGQGRLFWGPTQNKDQTHNIEKSPAEELLEKIELSEWVADIQESSHRKWLFNTVLNGFTAAHRLATNGEALNHLPGLEGLFNEAWELGGILFGGFSGEKNEIWLGFLSLIQDTATNENSMARDVRLGRKTESDFLAGIVKIRQIEADFPGLTYIHKRCTV